MSDFFLSGRAVDLVLVVIFVEFMALVALSRRGRGRAVLDALFALGPGACLLMGLRAALTGAGWPVVALWVSASFPFHLVDLWRRFK